MTQTTVTFQVDSISVSSTPAWMGEVAVFAQVMAHLGLRDTIQEQVRFARARFGSYDTIDFLVVLIGYALSGEPTLKAFYERLAPFAETFMSLFGRSRLPDRSTLSRFLAALDQASVEALRTIFLADLVARTPFPSPGGMSDRLGNRWWIIDIDATKQVSRQRALPHKQGLPAPHRRLSQRLSSRLHRTQAGRSCEDTDDRLATLHASMDRHLTAARAMENIEKN